jgi:hypothetical protein
MLVIWGNSKKGSPQRKTNRSSHRKFNREAIILQIIAEGDWSIEIKI